MVDYTKPENRGARANSQVKPVEYDMGLRTHMLKVYNYMSGALGLSGLIAYLVANSEMLLGMIYQLNAQGHYSPTILGYIAMFSPLVFIVVLSWKFEKMSLAAVQGTFWTFAAVMGISLSSILLIYTGASVIRVFFITSALFGAMSLYGYTTKKDLSSLGSFLMMGVIGLIIAMVVNVFMQSTILQYIISGVGVIIFTLLAAYDTQKIKQIYYMARGNSDYLSKAAVMGALSLYITFINLMQFLLQFLGDRR